MTWMSPCWLWGNVKNLKLIHCPFRSKFTLNIPEPSGLVMLRGVWRGLGQKNFTEREVKEAAMSSAQVEAVKYDRSLTGSKWTRAQLCNLGNRVLRTLYIETYTGGDLKKCCLERGPRRLFPFRHSIIFYEASEPPGLTPHSNRQC